MRLVAMLTLLAGSSLLAADSAKPARTVEDLGFFAGHWRTSVWGGSGEEIWMKPDSGNIIGVWRFVKDGKLVFTEHLSVEDDAERGPVMRLKHFHPGMKGWEEKNDSVTMYLEKFEPGDAVFGSDKDGKRVTLRYRTPSPGVLECTLVRKTGEKSDETVFVMKRSD